MGKRASSRSEKVAEWTVRLEQWKASGLSVARFSERAVSRPFRYIFGGRSWRGHHDPRRW